jgi:hypothetical protein
VRVLYQYLYITFSGLSVSKHRSLNPKNDFGKASLLILSGPKTIRPSITIEIMADGDYGFTVEDAVEVRVNERDTGMVLSSGKRAQGDRKARRRRRRRRRQTTSKSARKPGAVL